MDFTRGVWLNAPPACSVEPDRLEVSAAAESDFWRITHYGYVHDSGHFLGLQVGGDFVADLIVKGGYREQYDQAGLMLRQDAAHWLKCGIELVDGVQQLSAVVTRCYSDWSVVPLATPPDALRLCVNRQGDFVEVRYSLDGERYALLRIAYLPPSPELLVGPMCAAPIRGGFTTVFEGFRVAPL